MCYTIINTTKSHSFLEHFLLKLDFLKQLIKITGKSMVPNIHSFHIPVMGTGYSIDTPIKVAHYGISSVVSLVDDTLIEQMRKFYSAKFNEAYSPITKYDNDFRAKRITEYLNLMQRIVEKQFVAVKSSAFEPQSEITKYFELLSNDSALKIKYCDMLNENNPMRKTQLQQELRESMRPGEINVNIMTKLDRDNYDAKGNKLPQEFSDALSALRGYAQSTLRSAIIFSAGINRRLYTYVEQFKDFYADTTGDIKKRIVLKVSDFRSSIIQGKFFAQKGIWISEYRVESGLNCGGHAFATDGYLMGPILEEFKQRRDELIQQLHQNYNKALALKNMITFAKPHQVRITAQGGIGTYNEDQFLREYYGLDATGWGTPFLLCPEATNVDDQTLKRLCQAGENDVYLSDVSPLGVPFNNLRGSLSDCERDARIAKGRPGSACPKGHLVSNTEFTDQPICTASRQYQKLKIENLQIQPISPEEFRKTVERITKKACICHDLGEGVLMNNNVPSNVQRFPAICPGPNIAYFSKVVTLREMVDHIYGRNNLVTDPNRPHMFIKELQMYIDYLRRDIEKHLDNLSDSQTKYFNEFKNNLYQGIEYYSKLFPLIKNESDIFLSRILKDLENCRQRLDKLSEQYAHAFLPTTPLISKAAY